jgi:hypothetical protein
VDSTKSEAALNKSRETLRVNVELAPIDALIVSNEILNQTIDRCSRFVSIAFIRSSQVFAPRCGYCVDGRQERRFTYKLAYFGVLAGLKKKIVNTRNAATATSSTFQVCRWNGKRTKGLKSSISAPNAHAQLGCRNRTAQNIPNPETAHTNSLRVSK